MADCSLYRHDRPSYIIEAHHVVPKSWFVGVPVDTPMVQLCPTCHMNVHRIIDDFVRVGRTLLPKPPPKQLLLAHQALELAREKGLTPRPTL